MLIRGSRGEGIPNRRAVFLRRVCATVIVLLLAGGVGAGAEPAPSGSPDFPHEPGAVLPEDARLDDYVRYAMKHNPDLAAVFHRWQAARETVPRARALPDPQFSFSVVVDRVERGPEYMGERYMLSQRVPWFGRRALGGEVAEARADAEAERLEAVRLDLVHRVSRAYFEYAFQHQALGIARENLNLLVRLESVSRAMFRAGSAALSDVNRAQMEIGRLDDQVRSLEDLLGVAAARLNVALGRPAHAPLPAAPPERPSLQPVPDLPARSDEAWLGLAREHNPGLGAARHDAEGQRRAVALAHKGYYPDVTVGVEYARGASARMAMMDGGGSDMLAGTVAVNLPVWRGTVGAGVRQGQARLGEAGRRVQSLENSLEADLKLALYNHRDSLRKVALYGGTLLPMARQTLATTETAYRAGDAGFSDLIDAQRVLLEFSLAHERAAADRAQAFTQIQALVGRPIHADPAVDPPPMEGPGGRRGPIPEPE